MTNLQHGEIASIDAFDIVAHNLSKAKTKTLSECVPLLDVALDFIDRGPAALTVDAVEKYREQAIKLLEFVRPVIERQARQSLTDWMLNVTDPAMELRAAA